ncbi:hypothetical protein ACKKBG_A33530 [Auxenochlorella protothecoides x Auxenochlorella symbiontica]
MPRAWVVVLGDVGRSPRMQYHTLSLCKTPGYTIDLIGQRGSPILNDLQAHVKHGRLRVTYLPEPPAALARCPRALRLVLKALHQLLTLAWLTLFSLPRPDVILLQLPPAIPTMAVLRAAALRHGARLVFDWHNYAYTLMGLSMGPRHLLVRLARRYERRWAPTAHAHLCVSRAMAVDLSRAWRVSAAVFHDRPTPALRPAKIEETHALLQRLRPDLARPQHPGDWLAAELAGTASSATPLTVRTAPGQAPARRGGRPALVLSSTSWTADEDFGLLLRAAELYDARARDLRKGESLPRIVFVVTGRGAGRAAYEARLHATAFSHVAFRLLWLSTPDYRLMLGSADLGICLHASSSGLDLPMKVVDMFGSGVPVCALQYPTITELVQPGVNGVLFATAEALAAQLLSLLAGWPERAGQLVELRRGAEAERARGWDEEWGRCVLPVLQGAET